MKKHIMRISMHGKNVDVDYCCFCINFAMDKDRSCLIKLSNPDDACKHYLPVSKEALDERINNLLRILGFQNEQ